MGGESGGNAIAFGSGLLAGFATTVLLHPLDVVKTRFQVDEAKRRPGQSLWQRLKLVGGGSGAGTGAGAGAGAGSGGGAGAGRGELLSTRAIHREAGLRGLYRGVVPAMIGSSMSWGIYFLLYEALKKRAAAAHGDEARIRLSAYEYLGASSLAGTLTTLCTNPVWLIKTRMELQTPGNEPYRGFLHALRTIVAREGVAGLYRGIVPALVLVSNGALQFMVYEELKIVVAAGRPLEAYDFMLLGALSKSVASTATYPYQVIKARMQQHGSTYASTWGTFRRILRAQGWTALYRGIVPNLVRVMPASAITFAVYELTSARLMKEKSDATS